MGVLRTGLEDSSWDSIAGALGHGVSTPLDVKARGGVRHPTAFEETSREVRQMLAARGQKALAAIHAASSAAHNAAILAINMAQESNLSANLANQAQAYLERYVYGRPVSALPANVAPMPPSLYAPPREVMTRGFAPLAGQPAARGVLLEAVAALVLGLAGAGGAMLGEEVGEGKEHPDVEKKEDTEGENPSVGPLPEHPNGNGPSADRADYPRLVGRTPSPQRVNRDVEQTAALAHLEGGV